MQVSVQLFDMSRHLQYVRVPSDAMTGKVPTSQMVTVSIQPEGVGHVAGLFILLAPAHSRQGCIIAKAPFEDNAKTSLTGAATALRRFPCCTWLTSSSTLVQTY